MFPLGVRMNTKSCYLGPSLSQVRSGGWSRGAGLLGHGALVEFCAYMESGSITG